MSTALNSVPVAIVKCCETLTFSAYGWPQCPDREVETIKCIQTNAVGVACPCRDCPNSVRGHAWCAALLDTKFRGQILEPGSHSLCILLPLLLLALVVHDHSTGTAPIYYVAGREAGYVPLTFWGGRSNSKPIDLRSHANDHGENLCPRRAAKNTKDHWEVNCVNAQISPILLPQIAVQPSVNKP